MATFSDEQAAEPSVKIVPGFHWDSKYDGLNSDTTAPDLVPESKYKHLFAVTARLNGKGECKAWLIKPDLVDLHDYALFGLGPSDPEDLMHEVFDWPRASMERDIVDKGVKFLQQFDMNYDYLKEELDDIRNYAWIVLFHNVHVEKMHRRQRVGTALVRAVMKEISQLAQLEGRPVLAFTKLEKSTLQPETRSPDLPSEKCQKNSQDARIQASFWESLALERLNDGQLFAKDLDWLAWSPKARNAALLFDRCSAFPLDFNALIESHLNDCE